MIITFQSLHGNAAQTPVRKFQTEPLQVPEFQAINQMDATFSMQQFGQQHYVSDYKQLLTGHAGSYQMSHFGYGGPALGPQAYGGPVTTPYLDRYNNQVTNCG